MDNNREVIKPIDSELDKFPFPYSAVAVRSLYQ